MRQVTSSDFIITTSVDGVLKFWKKQATGIEFVKQYRAHVGSVDGEALRRCVGAWAQRARMHARMYAWCRLQTGLLLLLLQLPGQGSACCTALPAGHSVSVSARRTLAPASQLASHLEARRCLILLHSNSSNTCACGHRVCVVHRRARCQLGWHAVRHGVER